MIWCTMVLQKAGVEVGFSRSLAVADFAMVEVVSGLSLLCLDGANRGGCRCSCNICLVSKKKMI